MPAVDDRALAQRRQRAQRHAEQHHDGERVEAQVRRQRRAALDPVRYRLGRPDRRAEVAVDRVLEPDPVLHQERVVEVVLLANRLRRLGGLRARAAQDVLDAAGSEVEQREDAERDDQQQHEQRNEPASDEQREEAGAHSGPGVVGGRAGAPIRKAGYGLAVTKVNSEPVCRSSSRRLESAATQGRGSPSRNSLPSKE